MRPERANPLEEAGVELWLPDEPHPDADQLYPGDIVKLIFGLLTPLTDGTRGERMWVEVTTVNGDEYVGFLTNEPHVLNLDPGDEVRFQPRHVVELWEGGDQPSRLMA